MVIRLTKINRETLTAILWLIAMVMMAGFWSGFLNH